MFLSLLFLGGGSCYCKLSSLVFVCFLLKLSETDALIAIMFTLEREEEEEEEEKKCIYVCTWNLTCCALAPSEIASRIVRVVSLSSGSPCSLCPISRGQAVSRDKSIILVLNLVDIYIK